MNYNVGIDLGSSTVKVVIIDEENKIIYRKKQSHFGQIVETVKEIISEIISLYKDASFKVLFTGVSSNLILDEKFIINDIPGIEQGLKLIFPNAKSAIEIGSQNARYLTGLSSEFPPKFSVNGDCAGGTGSFFEDQMYRLGLEIEDYSHILEKAVSVPRLSGRCSVFAKTDIIHRQQDGVPTPDILLGLCYGAIRNLKATIIKNLPLQKPLALCGGITHNSGVVEAVKEIFELESEELLINEDSEYIQAIGTAIFAKQSNAFLSIDESYKITCEYLKSNIDNSRISRLDPLIISKNTVVEDPICVPINGVVNCSLGIDVGSTSTNLVLINDESRIIDFQYLRTKGDPQGVVKQGIKSIRDKFGDSIIIQNIGVTGSGRHLIGKMIGAGSVKDEITAQARAAIYVCPNVDTVFEIGGQDSKYIEIENGQVKDFQMNKICAAGTGSFIEEQASRLNIAIEEYGEKALRARSPVDLGERCTVFIESNIAACLSKGIETPDILAGLCHSIIRNYLFKVVGNKPVGDNIVLQGGVCYNPGIVAAFQAVYGEKITVSPYFSISGAYGMAIIAHEEINQKKEEKDIIQSNINFYDKSKEYLLEGYERNILTDKKTIGVPYVLVVHKLFPMIRSYFEKLGYSVLLSPETDDKIIELSQKYAQAETCYPVKLIYGHMAWLMEKKVDYIFLPSILTMKHESSKVHKNYGCVYMQSAPKLIFDSMGISKKGIELLNPIFSLDFGKKAIASALIGVGTSLGHSKSICTGALISGGTAVVKYTNQVEKLGKELINSLKPEDRALVIVTRNYGIDDPVLNMGIPEELLKRGHKVITLSHLPAHDLDISKEYENLYWPFGQHIISGAKLIANHPNLYAVYLTNHGCGPDTMISHLFQKEMGTKPYLNIEVDEHFSKVGVITRIEAFLNSLNSQPVVNVKNSNEYFSSLPKYKVDILDVAQRETKLYLPYLYPYSQIISDMLNKNGYNTEVLPQTNNNSLSLGRSITTSKEYLAFTALAGDTLTIARQSEEQIQVLIPQTEGSEADGMYARVIYDFLPENSKTKIVGLTLETLPFISKLSKEIFLTILAGDIVMLAPRIQREEILGKLLDEKTFTLEYLCSLAEDIICSKEEKIGVIGDPYILYNSYLNENILSEIEEDGRKIQWMPLSEYLCYMWKRRAQTKEEIEIVGEFEEQIKLVSIALGENSPFSESLQILHNKAQESLPDLTGANVAYRFAKQRCSIGCKAIVDISSMYENAQAILELVQNENETPLFSLSFEGTNNINQKERLQSFLHYIPK